MKNQNRDSVGESPGEKTFEKVGDSSAHKIRHALGVLFDTSAVVELRGLKDRVPVSGYFDAHDRLTEEAAKLDQNGFAVYVTLNEVKSALLARSVNRVKRYPQATTSDTEVLRRLWLPLDFDPVRPTNLSSTDAEKEAALLRASEVRDFLRTRDWPEPVVADSGNGAHLLYRVNLPNDGESHQLVKSVLEALAFKFSDAMVNLDTSVQRTRQIGAGTLGSRNHLDHAGYLLSRPARHGRRRPRGDGQYLRLTRLQ